MVNLTKPTIEYNGYRGIPGGTRYLKKTIYSAFNRYPEQIPIIGQLMEKKDGPLRMLNVGIAQGEEPLTYLKAAFDIHKKQPLRNVPNILDLYMVDAMRHFTLHPQAKDYCSPEAIEHLNNLARIKGKTFMGTPIETFVQKPPLKSFDVILFNNVLQHMDHSDTKSSLSAIEKLMKMVKKGGILCMEPELEGLEGLARKMQNSELANSLYEKIESLLQELDFKKIAKATFKRG